jgi:hypothetical protein
MSILTGADEKEPPIIGNTVDDCMEEIQEMQAQLDAVNSLLETGQKARLAYESSMKEEMKKCLSMYQQCMDKMDQPEEKNTEASMLKGMLDEEHKEHADTKKTLLKLQADIVKITGIVRTMGIPKATIKEISLEVIQNDSYGKTHKMVMTKGSRKILMEVAQRDGNGKIRKLIMTKE